MRRRLTIIGILYTLLTTSAFAGGDLSREDLRPLKIEKAYTDDKGNLLVEFERVMDKSSPLYRETMKLYFGNESGLYQFQSFKHRFGAEAFEFYVKDPRADKEEGADLTFEKEKATLNDRRTTSQMRSLSDSELVNLQLKIRSTQVPLFLMPDLRHTVYFYRSGKKLIYVETSVYNRSEKNDHRVFIGGPGDMKELEFTGKISSDLKETRMVLANGKVIVVNRDTNKMYYDGEVFDEVKNFTRTDLRSLGVPGAGIELQNLAWPNPLDLIYGKLESNQESMMSVTELKQSRGHKNLSCLSLF